MRTRTLAALAVLLAAGLACDTKPATIHFDPPPAPILTTGVVSLNATAVNKKGSPLKGQRVAYSAAPSDVLEVSASGGLRCLKTGDVTLTLTAGDLSQPVAVKCRLPAEIAMPAEIQLVLGRPPVPLRPKVLGEGGKTFDDVAAAIASSDASIVAVEGDALKPVAVGKARALATAGGITAVAPVEVVESVVSEPLTLRDGAARSFTLQPGLYLVTIELKTDPRLKQGVTAAWTGTACDNEPEQPSHRFRCRVEETATLTVKNPALMGVGATVNGQIDVFRVPG